MKLKPIPSNTVVHTPTEAEAKELLAILHEGGYCWTSGKSLLENNYWHYRKDDTAYLIFSDKKMIDVIIAGVFNSCILTLAEFKERYVLNEDNFAKSEEEKPQPKFKVGDKVRIIQDGTVNPDYVGIIDEIIAINQVICLRNTDSRWFETSLEPYTESETKPTEDMETKENRNLSQDVANCDKSESKQLNLCELLDGHTDGLFYSPYFGEVEVSIGFCDAFPIIVNGEHLTNDGRLYLNDDCMPSIFPSRALYEQYPLDPYTAWMKWQEEQTQILMSVTLGAMGDGNTIYKMLQFRTPADRDKCLEEINAIINKYSK